MTLRFLKKKHDTILELHSLWNGGSTKLARLTVPYVCIGHQPVRLIVFDL